MTFNAEEATHLIRNRRSVFTSDYSGDRVPDEVIELMLENANWAPTHKFTEPWRFKVYCDEGMKTLAEIHQNTYKDSGKKSDDGKLKKFESKFKKCSHIIAICMKRHKSIPKMEEIAAVSAAVQNMHLTASANGVGCYWSTGGITYMEEANKYFDLGKKDLLMGFLYVGVPKKGKWPKSKRKDISKKVEWVRE